MNTESLYTVLLSPAGAVVETELPPGWYLSHRHEPPLIDLPRLPRTSAAWTGHSVDAAGHLLRVERETPALAVRVDSLPGGVDETGDGTAEHPFVNLDSLRRRFSDCLIHALNCAGVTLSVTVTGTVDYGTYLPGGSSGDSVVYDFSQAEVGGAALFRNADPGTPVIRNLRAPCSIFGSNTAHTVFNDCSWGAPAVSFNRMMYGAHGCTFDRCTFDTVNHTFTLLDNTTFAGGSLQTSGGNALQYASRCVLSGVTVVCEEELNYPYYGYAAIYNARESVFEQCSASLICRVNAWADDSPNSDWFNAARAVAVTSCVACVFDRCDASVTLGSGGFRHLCFQACGFHANSASVYNECRGDSFLEGYCPESRYTPMSCEP